MRFPQPVPELPVGDVRAAGEAYARQLGFTVDWVYEDFLAGISRDDARVFLRRRTPEEAREGYSVLIWVNLDSAAEVDRLHAEWKERGVAIVDDLRTTSYDLREFTAQDSDGNRFRVFHDIGSSARAAPVAIRPGAVIFTGDRARLARFYMAVAGLTERFADERVTVLASDSFELVIHSLEGEPSHGEPPPVRADSWVKPFFPVKSLSEARERAAAFGGELRPRSEEWEARGFRACEAIDPDGNVIQFRERP